MWQHLLPQVQIGLFVDENHLAFLVEENDLGQDCSENDSARPLSFRKYSSQINALEKLQLSFYGFRVWDLSGRRPRCTWFFGRRPWCVGASISVPRTRRRMHETPPGTAQDVDLEGGAKFSPTGTAPAPFAPRTKQRHLLLLDRQLLLPGVYTCVLGVKIWVFGGEKM